jgi:hypothetical protein
MKITNYVTCGPRNEWRWLFRKTNGTSFTPILLSFELDRVGGTLDIEVMVLGLGFYLCIAVMPPSKLMMDALREIAERKSS